MNTVCQKNKCSGCMACLEVCKKNAISIQDNMSSYNAIINSSKCIECGQCYKICHNNISINFNKPISWYQGWANSEQIRMISSSGGFATAIGKAFVNNGGIVCSCTFQDSKFCFTFAEIEQDIDKFAGSKYVKSNPEGIYKKIREYLKRNRSVLFIGLPCQVAAVKTFIEKKLWNNLYTIDLICHGTPSPKNLDKFLNQYGYTLKNINNIRFRKKPIFNDEKRWHSFSSPVTFDRYTLAFLNAVNYTENCYSCNYAKLKRVSDITIGDAWGSNLSRKEQKKGISLALCQTKKGENLLMKANLHLEIVDLTQAIENNHQLERPSIKPKRYKEFFFQLQNNKTYNTAVNNILPKQCFNQKIKQFLNKMKILKEKVIFQILIDNIK